MIKARRKPNAVAARALTHAGTGHKYWSEYDPEIRQDIEKLSREIYDILFDPSLQTPIKTLDLPVAGRGYSADSLSLIFEFVNYVNALKPEMWLDEPKKRSGKGKERPLALPDDADGSTTREYLRKVKRIASRISGDSPRSLGLHPAVYFYGATGRYQPTAFLATVALVQEMERNDSFIAFTEARADFEEFLLKYRYFINQLVVTHGSGTKGLEPVLTMYRIILEGIREKLGDGEIIAKLQSNQRLRSLKVNIEADSGFRKNFTTETKSAAFMRSAIESAPRCAICNARIHVKSISFDHKIPKREGGLGDIDNAQLAHPFCNTGYKEHVEAKKAKRVPPSVVGDDALSAS